MCPERDPDTKIGRDGCGASVAVLTCHNPASQRKSAERRASSKHNPEEIKQRGEGYTWPVPISTAFPEARFLLLCVRRVQPG
jgi:hypothetical protein